jgi:hypothetical protein
MKNCLLLLFFLPLITNSQKSTYSFPFEKKDQFFSIQYGFPNTIKNNLESFIGFTQTNKKSIGPVSIAYEYHINPLLSLGISISYGSYSADYKDILNLGAAFKGTLRNTALLLQSTKYFETDKKILPYAKGSIGLNLWSGEYKTASGNDYQNFNAPTPLGYNAVVGIKYGFSRQTFGYLEAGYGKYVVAAGVSFRLNRTKD